MPKPKKRVRIAKSGTKKVEKSSGSHLDKLLVHAASKGIKKGLIQLGAKSIAKSDAPSLIAESLFSIAKESNNLRIGKLNRKQFAKNCTKHLVIGGASVGMIFACGYFGDPIYTPALGSQAIKSLLW